MKCYFKFIVWTPLLCFQMLAVVYDAFTRIEKEKFRRLFLHKRKAAQHAFRLLVTKERPEEVSFQHFEGLLSAYKPRASECLDLALAGEGPPYFGGGGCKLTCTVLGLAYGLGVEGSSRQVNPWIKFMDLVK